MFIISFRWLHVICACLLVGATFFLSTILVPATRELDPHAADLVYIRSRRRFKMLVHSTTLFLLLSGIYNAVKNWGAYHQNIPLTHAMFGSHVLAALIVFAILFVLLARKQPGPSERRGVRVALVLMFVTVLLASTLKYAREHPKPQSVLENIQVSR